MTIFEGAANSRARARYRLSQALIGHYCAPSSVDAPLHAQCRQSLTTGVANSLDNLRQVRSIGGPAGDVVADGGQSVTDRALEPLRTPRLAQAAGGHRFGRTPRRARFLSAGPSEVDDHPAEIRRGDLVALRFAGCRLRVLAWPRDSVS